MKKIVPLPPVMINGIKHYRADFVFTADEFLKPIPGIEKSKPVRDLIAMIERDVVNASSSRPTPAKP